MKENIYFRLLKNRSFMAYWSSTTLLRLASDILQFALAVYVLDIEGSAFVYSTVLSIIILPRILCSSFAGYLADCKDSIQILRKGTFGLSILIACFFAVHMLAIPLNLLLIYALVILLELYETFINPAQGKALAIIVTEEEISYASKLACLDDGIAEILSPVTAAYFYSCFGLTGVFGITLFIEASAFFLTLLIHKNKLCANAGIIEDKHLKFSLKDTYNAYANAASCLKNHPYIIGIMLLAPLFNFFVSPLFSITAPHYFCITMQSDVDMYAMFNASLGISGLISPLLAMVFISDKDEYRTNSCTVSASAAILLCVGSILHFAGNILPPIALIYIITAAMSLLVAGVTIMNIAASITIKKHIPKQILGRAISIVQLFAAISIPIGQLFFGLCADKLHVSASYFLSAAGLSITLAVMVKTYHAVNNEAGR